jgi:PucR C-terminal helix-turn-helix domain
VLGNVADTEVVNEVTRSEPWRRLPASVADVIEPELPAAAEDIMATIPREVPEYARPFEGSFGRGVRVGVTEALAQFVALIRDPEAGRDREVYVTLGRGELRQGRTLDSLQSAYRVGARVAWRRIADAARRAGLGAEVLSLLAESIFAYIDELSADSVEGYAQAQSERAGERQRRRRDLLALLIREPPAAEVDLRAAAAAAGWRAPRQVAALACPEDDVGRLAHRLAAELAASLQGAGCVVVADPAGPGRAREVEAAADGIRAALGPPGTVAELPRSWRLATATLEVAAGDGLRRADDHLAGALLLAGREAVARMAERRLAPFVALTPKARARMEETALAYVHERGNAAAMARALQVHPQTARYRLARLRELLGDDLDDPDARFELEAALRASR